MTKPISLLSILWIALFICQISAHAGQKLPADQIKCANSLDEMDDVLHDNYGGNFNIQDRNEAIGRLCSLWSQRDQKCDYTFGDKNGISTTVYYGADHYCFITKASHFNSAMLFLSSAVNMMARDHSIMIGSASQINKMTYELLANEKDVNESSRYFSTDGKFTKLTKEEAEKDGNYRVITERRLNLGSITLVSTYQADYVKHEIKPDEPHHSGQSWMLQLKKNSELTE